MQAVDRAAGDVPRSPLSHGQRQHMEPKPSETLASILMGGRADAVLKRSTKEADGWIAGGQGTPEAFREAWLGESRSYAQAAGKAPTLWMPDKLMYISVDADRERCRAQLRANCHAYYGPQFDVEIAAPLVHLRYVPPGSRASSMPGPRLSCLAQPGPTWSRWGTVADEVVPRACSDASPASFCRLRLRASKLSPEVCLTRQRELEK